MASDKLIPQSRESQILRYTNAPMMVFVQEGTLVTIRGRFVRKCLFLLIIFARLCSGKAANAAGFGKLYTQKTSKN